MPEKPKRFVVSKMDKALLKVSMRDRRKLGKAGRLYFFEHYKPGRITDEAQLKYLYICLEIERRAKQAAERVSRRRARQMAERDKLFAVVDKLLKQAIADEDWEKVKEARNPYVPPVTREEVAEVKKGEVDDV